MIVLQPSGSSWRHSYIEIPLSDRSGGIPAINLIFHMLHPLGSFIAFLKMAIWPSNCKTLALFCDWFAVEQLERLQVLPAFWDWKMDKIAADEGC